MTPLTAATAPPPGTLVREVFPVRVDHPAVFLRPTLGGEGAWIAYVHDVACHCGMPCVLPVTWDYLVLENPASERQHTRPG